MKILELKKYNNGKKVKLKQWPYQQNGGNKTEQRIRKFEDTAIGTNLDNREKINKFLKNGQVSRTCWLEHKI